MFVSTHYSPTTVFAKWAQVKLDGVDISRDCYAVNDTLGAVLCYRRNENGLKYLDPRNLNRAARELRRGKVELSLVPNAPERIQQLWAQKAGK